MRFNFSENEQRLLIENDAAVLPIPYAFIHSSVRDTTSFYNPKTAFERRLGTPLKYCLFSTKDYFIAPFESGASWLCNTGAFISIGLLPISLIPVAYAAMSELLTGLWSLCQSLFYLIKGDFKLSGKYALDGASRLLLSPALLVVAFVSLPVEFVRFITRFVSTLVHIIKEALKPAPGVEEQPDLQKDLGLVLEPGADNKTAFQSS